jgi:hypothetical protein
VANFVELRTTWYMDRVLPQLDTHGAYPRWARRSSTSWALTTLRCLRQSHMAISVRCPTPPLPSTTSTMVSMNEFVGVS